VSFDVADFERHAQEEAAHGRRHALESADPAADAAAGAERAQRARALRHALSEFDVKVFMVRPVQPLGEALVG
jgi:hypothetical protein